MSSAVEFAQGIVLAYFVCALIWIELTRRNINNPGGLGGVLFVVGFLSMMYRNWAYFIRDGLVVSEDIMYSNFITPATFLAASILFVWYKRQ
jgi:hypothetical protein